jgi:hypothetical protein
VPLDTAAHASHNSLITNGRFDAHKIVGNTSPTRIKTMTTLTRHGGGASAGAKHCAPVGVGDVLEMFMASGIEVDAGPRKRCGFRHTLMIHHGPGERLPVRCWGGRCYPRHSLSGPGWRGDPRIFLDHFAERERS